MTPEEWRARAAERFAAHGLNPDYSLALELLVFGEAGCNADQGEAIDAPSTVDADDQHTRTFAEDRP
jgi:hypothetical protein